MVKYNCIVRIGYGGSVGAEGEEVGAVSDEQEEGEDPDAVHEDAGEGVVLEVAVGVLVDAVVEQHQCGCVDVVEGFELGVVDAEAVQEADGVGPPGDVAVQDQRRDDEQAADVVHEEPFLAQRVAPVHQVLHRHVVDVVQPGEDQEEARQVVRPEGFVDVGVSEAVDAGDDEGQHEDCVAVDPDFVGEVVVPLQVQHYYIRCHLQQGHFSSNEHVDPTGGWGSGWEGVERVGNEGVGDRLFIGRGSCSMKGIVGVIIQMDVIYHRNCMDGVFSSLIAYLTARLIDQTHIDQFLQELTRLSQSGVQDMTDLQPAYQPLPLTNEQSIDEEFFHGEKGVHFNAYSFYAGEYYNLKFPGNAPLLFVIDTNLGSADNLRAACTTHKFVVMIDHHTSFKDMRAEVESMGLKNLFIVFKEGPCAGELSLDFMDRFFGLKKRLPAVFRESLCEKIRLVGANDTKIGETRESKTFVLGFYYFGLELSHTNPNLYKRLGLMDLAYTMERGKNQYSTHLKDIQEEITRAKVCEFGMSGKFKGKQCLFLEPRNSGKISDLGNVLACLSSRQGMENLAVLCMKKYDEIRMSCRSHHAFGEPQALNLAKIFGGGGHTEAAGFKITPNQLKSQLKIRSIPTLKLSIEEVENILLGGKQ